MDYKQTLDNLQENFNLREIRHIDGKDEKYIYVGGEKLINLTSNNYLGFADNKKLLAEFDCAGYPFGSASARLLTGNLPIYEELENLITDLFNHSTNKEILPSRDILHKNKFLAKAVKQVQDDVEKNLSTFQLFNLSTNYNELFTTHHSLLTQFDRSTLIYNSGYHANIGTISAIAERGDVIFSDKLNHASIIDGMKLSEAKFFRYPHNDMESLGKLLIRERENFENAVIVTESVFSMDGDIADLRRLTELKEKYNCILIVDEAHAFGVFGEKGLGVCESLGLIDKADLIMGTFGKAIGSYGAFVTGRKVLIDYLINKSRSFIFSTALPPVNIAFTKWIIENKLPQTLKKRQVMLTCSKKLLQSESQIIPIHADCSLRAVELCEKLKEHGYFALPIRKPTVQTPRVRISLTTEITEEDLVNLCSIIG